MAGKSLYVMISRTESRMGRLIRLFTRYDYNHVSLTLDPEFRSWVSFARYYCNAPLYGGYIVEPAERYLASGKSSRVRIFQVEISEEKFEQLSARFDTAGNPDSGMIYNIFDAMATPWGRSIQVQNAYTCLGFANEVLGQCYANISELDRDLSDRLVYEGELKDVVHDSGCRDDIYFTRLGAGRVLWYTMKNLTRLSKRAVRS